MMEDKLITTEEVAEMLHCNRQKVSDLRDYGVLNFVKMGKCYLHKKSEVLNIVDRWNGADFSNTETIEVAVALRRH